MGNSFSSSKREEYSSVTRHNERADRKASFHELDDRQLLIKLLKVKYKRHYDAVQPIPYIRDRLYCVDKVFVEGGIEYKAGSWIPLDSYHSVFTNSQIKSVRRVIIGEAGYGKSTLTLQYAYDWCNGIKESFLRDVDILILLRLRQLGGVHSIYKAVKEFLLPSNAQLTESNIQSVIDSSSSVVVILDGYDEYPDAESDIRTDVLKIISMQMFEKFEVILTTRYLPKRYSPVTKQFRLTGFDEQARDEYIRKAVVGNSTSPANAIKRRLRENPVLGDLCQVPLIFVMFAHMSHENSRFKKFKTVTSFFQYMIKCFHSHMRNKMKDKNVKRHELNEKYHRTLDEVAFEGLSKKTQQIVWRRGVLRDRLGHYFYDQYISVGILVEDEVTGDIDESGGASFGQHQREVRFYHKLFCEWYAAHHLAEYAEECDLDNLKQIAQNMDPFDLQYCYRFACGLNDAAAGKIIQYVKEREGGDKFAVLCILEKGGKVDDILDTVKEMCSKRIQFNNYDSTLLQRSIVQLLELASSHKISISEVCLYNCFSTVDLSGGNHLPLKSNISIPVLTTLNKITICEDDREITAEEFAAILQYSSKCLALKELMFWECLLPQSGQAESVSVLGNVEVLWCTLNYTWFKLNLRSCLWERKDFETRHELGVMTDQDYQKEVERFRQTFGTK